ncbi:MAG: hypothetical protein NDJ89_12410 [Oligoflexia bacterium]|nr:hypothetical protein [Oligoflexia bacterium]
MNSTTSASQALPILLNLVAAVFGALGQYYYKLGSARLGTDSLLRNWPLFLGVVLFCGVMVLFVAAFKLGGRLSVTYPMYATTFAWGLAIAHWLGREPVRPLQLGGVLVIVAGVVLVALGSRE